ncbi:uncharacterized protein LOC143519403 [Brachyhypopomus gauderio]|uniref:uncharacterized protein LOC143519403 n=1 Tax=Brachyhypopomus gauderio TaxID=698409 RepID=UPI004042BB33
MTDKDTHFESNAQENRQQLESGSTLATCSSAHKPMIYYNPKMTARISPVSRQLEPMKDHAIDITSGQNSSSEDIVEEGVCVPRLKRTRSVIRRLRSLMMKEKVRKRLEMLKNLKQLQDQT